MPYSQEIIDLIWEKGKVVKGFNPDVLRKDIYGAWIIKDHFGSQDSEYAWEIDFKVSLSKGGEIKESNMQPMQWENKTFKDAGQLAAHVTSYNSSNVLMR